MAPPAINTRPTEAHEEDLPGWMDHSPDTQSSAAKISTFWDGSTLPNELEAGSFGRFHSAMQRLGPTINLKDFKLPKLVVIGNQNRGKSSLMESITKCPIFPRGDDTTTRAPVRLRLQHVDNSQHSLIQVKWKRRPVQRLPRLEDIVGAVRAIMAIIPMDDIVADEIIVLIRDPTMINIEFIDLPGIVAAPQGKKEQTEGLVRKYLQDRESMFLCVEEASCSNLDGCQAVGLVREADKTQHTIMVLTKPDTLKAKEVRKRLTLRLMRRSGEVTDTDFAGCIAVINRSHHDEKTLVEAGDEEAETFEAHVFRQVPEMPQRICDLPPAMQRNLCLHNLISQVEAMYRAFIIKEWRPTALQHLRPIIDQAEAALHKLGPHPNSMSVKQILTAIQDQLDFSAIALELTSRAVIGTEHSRFIRDIGSCPKGSLEEAVQLKLLVTAAMKGIEEWLQQAAYLRLVQNAVHSAFRVDTGLQLKRFANLELEIVMNGLQRVVDIQHIKESLMQSIKPMSVNYQLLPDLGSKLVGRLETACLTHILQEVLHPLEQGAFISCVPEDFPLEESVDVQQERQRQELHLQNLQHALDVINNIHKEVDDPRASAAHQESDDINLGAEDPEGQTRPSNTSGPDQPEPSAAEQSLNQE